jgi:hypothetical protein
LDSHPAREFGGQLVRDPLIVGIQKRYVLASGNLEAGVPRRSPASIRLGDNRYCSAVTSENTRVLSVELSLITMISWPLQVCAQALSSACAIVSALL